MINEGDFRERVNDMIYNPNSYTKEDYYEAFLEMNERYLDELISTINLENAVTDGMDEENANKILKDIATSDPILNDIEGTNMFEPDQVEVIFNLMDYINCKLGHNIGNNDFPYNEE